LKSFVAKMMEKPMKVEMKNQMNFFFDKIKRNKNMGFPSKLALVIIGFFG
jgi:hypothetical protein